MLCAPATCPEQLPFYLHFSQSRLRLPGRSHPGARPEAFAESATAVQMTAGEEIGRERKSLKLTGVFQPELFTFLIEIACNAMSRCNFLQLGAFLLADILRHPAS